MASNVSTFAGAIAGLAERAAAAYRRRRTAQIVSDLPEYLRKDIGFYRDDRDTRNR
jgi:Domain of unknown function (DUF1127)